MESDQQPLSQTPPYENSLNDDDLVDMNEIIKCNNWNRAAESVPDQVNSQEIKLESYNFLGTRINYDEQYHPDSFPPPEHYFNPDIDLPNYDTDGEEFSPANNMNGKLKFSTVISLTDSEDDDVNIVDNTLNNLTGKENETSMVSNSSIHSNLMSIRSDHNYSSQELFIVSPNESIMPTNDEPIQCVEESPKESVMMANDEPSLEVERSANESVKPTDGLIKEEGHQIESAESNEIQSFITSFLNNNASVNKIDILFDLENEVKRMKATMLDVRQYNIDLIPKTEIQNGCDTNHVESSDEIDDNYDMSEGHSEPLEYRPIPNHQAISTKEPATQDTTTEDTLIKNAVSADTTKEIDVKINSSNSDELSVQQNINTCDSTQIENDSVNSENDNNISEQHNRQEPTTSKETLEDPPHIISPSLESNHDILDNIENIRLEIEQISLNLTSFSDSVENSESIVGVMRVKLTNLANAGQKLVESIEVISDIVDAEIKKNMAEDKARKLNDKSKERWLQLSSEDPSHSDGSASEENAVVRRRRKRRCASSSVDSDEEKMALKSKRNTNALFDSDSEDGNELNSPKKESSEEWQLNNGRCSNIGTTEGSLAEKLKSESSESDEENTPKPNSESEDDLKYMDMSKYLIMRQEQKEQTELPQETIVDSELEEFLGFDSSTSAVEAVQQSLDDEIAKIAEQPEELELTSSSCDVAERITTTEIEKEDVENKYENVNAENVGDAILPSQEWNEREDTTPINDLVHNNNLAGAEQLPANLSEDNIDKNSSEQETDEEDVYDSDDEIDKLVDFSTIPTKSRPIVNYVPVYKKKSSTKPKPKENLLDILKDSTNQEADTDTSSEEEIMSEEQYVLQLAKQRWLKDTSDESAADSESEDNDDRSTIDGITDESNDSNDSKINNFLKKRLVTEIEDIENDQRIDTIIGETSAKTTLVEDISTKEKTVEERSVQEMISEEAAVAEINAEEINAEEINAEEMDAEEMNAEEMNAEEMNAEEMNAEEMNAEEMNIDDGSAEPELQSSGIFEPEIELHDGDKLLEKDSDEDKGSDDDTSITLDKISKDKQKWKLDKIAFNKNLFTDIDNVDDKRNDAQVINSDNSDCEMLDISMFKTKKTTDDLDKIIQSQRKRDTSKTNKVADECISLSSDSDLEIDKGIIDDESEDEKPTTKSRPMLRNDQLAGETKQAQKEETDRLKRLDKKTERLTQIVETQSQQLSQSQEDSDVILDFDTKRKYAITVHPEIVKNLKEHQIAGVKFMYDCCYGSIDSIDKHPGSGCILAHCMGLGKTLQLIALLHTLIRYPQLKTKKILVICPKSTIMNWADEIRIWLRSVKVKLKVLHFPDPSDINKKLQILREWHLFKTDPEGKAGCMLIGYEAFRSLVFYYKKPKPEMSQSELDRIHKQVDEYLLKPGADLVVCDEGHVIKNRKSTTSLAVNKITSRRRIILTGTPIQNNLKEYYSMVNFIKPSFLGTEKEFANLYENPIKEGQHKDSDKQQIRIMKQRSYVLHKKLSKFVQRREAALLKTFLPEKYEYVLFIPMTELQNRLYEYFLANNPLKEKYGGKSLIPDYTFLRKIWTHPKVLESAWKNAIALRDKRAAAKKRIMESDEEPDDVLDNQIGKMSVENDWWRQFIDELDLKSILPSNKLRILFEILKLCQQTGEKCLIFSAFVAVLDVVEFFMKQINENVQFSSGSDLGLSNFHGPWIENVDYFRLDGKTSKARRHAMIQSFNNPNNQRVKCFLISAKAGGQGINLVGANRVILLDTSWNPSNDQQNIFRVFRLGQQKKCYIYRLLAMGTMEEKVYSRSVTKQAMSFRVVDEQQIDRHYSLAELAELYTLTKPDPEAQPSPVRPADNILANLLRNFKNLVYKYHEHDSLLENNSAEDLNEQEKADAWAAYENDVSMKNQFANINMTGDGMYANPYGNLSMGLNMMHPYSFIPPSLPSSMVPSYLQRMGYQTGVEQELLLMSQMYSSLNQTAGASNYGPLPSIYGSPASGSGNQLFSSPSSSTNNYYKSISPITTTSPSGYTNNITTPISSNVFNGMNALTSSAANAQTQNLMYNLSRYGFPNLNNSSNQAPSSSSSSSRPSSASIPSAFPSSFNLYGNPTSNNVTNTRQALPITQPGPNAIKNPLLSNLLPPPPATNAKDPFSIPTSVITKASKDQRASSNTVGAVNRTSPLGLSPTHTQTNRSTTPINAIIPSQSRPISTHSSHNSTAITMTKAISTSRGSSLSSARGSPLTVTRGNPLTVSRGNPLNVSRGSPLNVSRASPLSVARGSPLASSTPSLALNMTTGSSHSETRNSPSLTRSSSVGTNRLTVSRSNSFPSKRNANQHQQQTSQLPLSITLTGNRTSPEPNIIVKDVTAINRTVERKEGPTSSPKPPTQPIKNFNMGIVYPKAPDKKGFDLSQNEKIIKAAHEQLNSLRNVSATQSTSANKIGISQQQHNIRARPVMTAIKRTNDSSGITRLLEKVAASTKTNMSSNLPTNEVTITPTKRLQKLTTPTTAISQLKGTGLTTIMPSTIRKPSIEINKINSALSSASRLPASTSITRQTTIPTGNVNTNTIPGRILSNSVNQISKPMPALTRHGSAPTLKLISQPSTVPKNHNNGIARTTTSQLSTGSAATKLNQNGVTKTPVLVRKTLSVTPNPMPKLVNFPTSSTVDKRKLEDLLSRNTGITLTKKPRIENSAQETKPIRHISLPSVTQRINRPKETIETIELE